MVLPERNIHLPPYTPRQARRLAPQNALFVAGDCRTRRFQGVRGAGSYQWYGRLGRRWKLRSVYGFFDGYKVPGVRRTYRWTLLKEFH